jgi:hypothetical protein
MAQSRSDNEKYWDMMKRKQLRAEYEEFLKSEHIESNPHSAHVFAI